jgi:hypothetical protein
MNPIDSLHIDGVPVKPSLFAVPDMSLSSARATMKAHSFSVMANAACLVHVLESAYAKWVAESKVDDETCGGAQDELAAAGYPEFSRAIEDSTLSELILGHYLLQDFLGTFTWKGHGQIEYWFDSVNSCHFADGYVHVLGRCYSRG